MIVTHAFLRGVAKASRRDGGYAQLPEISSSVISAARAQRARSDARAQVLDHLPAVENERPKLPAGCHASFPARTRRAVSHNIVAFRFRYPTSV